MLIKMYETKYRGLEGILIKEIFKDLEAIVAQRVEPIPRTRR